MLETSNEIIKDWGFWFCALSGTCLFIIQLVILLVGGGPHSSLEGGDSDPSDAEFKWFSKLALTDFLMMFGWVGLTCTRQFHLKTLPASGMALLSGFLSFLMIGFIFRGAAKLKSPGTVLRLEEAIGKQATIYQQIPVGGTGKVSLCLHGFSYEIDAISPHSETLSSFTEVEIIKKMDEKTLMVVPKFKR